MTPELAPVERPRARPKLLQRRVDWLTLAFRVELGHELVTYLEARAELAAQHGKADVELVDPNGRTLLFAMKRTRAPRRWYLENAEFRALVDLEAPGRHRTPPPASAEVPGWTVELIPFATYLATHELSETLEALRDTAAAFGKLHGERLRRVDLAADFEGWTLDRSDVDAWVKHPRAHLFAYLERPTEPENDDAEEEPPRLHFVQGAFTGFTVGQGGPVRMRLYDKTRELKDNEDEAKQAIEHSAWHRSGWSGSDVVRLEFQLRGTALDELSARDPLELGEKLDPLWQYLSQRWCRLVTPNTASRLSRCKLDPRWQAAQAVVFRHETTTPAARVRLRGACSFEQLFGSLCSYLAAEGLTHKTADTLRRAGDERAVAAAMSEQERAAFLRSIADELAGELSRELARVWLRSPEASTVKTLTILRAYRARFATAPPKKRGPPN